MEAIHSKGKTSNTTGASPRRSVENNILFEEIVGKGLSEKHGRIFLYELEKGMLCYQKDVKH